MRLSKMGCGRWRRCVVPVLIVTLALAPRLAFGELMHEWHSNKSFSLIHGDVAEYTTLGQNLVRHG